MSMKDSKIQYPTPKVIKRSKPSYQSRRKRQGADLSQFRVELAYTLLTQRRIK